MAVGVWLQIQRDRAVRARSFHFICEACCVWCRWSHGKFAKITFSITFSCKPLRQTLFYHGITITFSWGPLQRPSRVYSRQLTLQKKSLKDVQMGKWKTMWTQTFSDPRLHTRRQSVRVCVRLCVCMCVGPLTFWVCGEIWRSIR